MVEASLELVPLPAFGSDDAGILRAVNSHWQQTFDCSAGKHWSTPFALDCGPGELGFSSESTVPPRLAATLPNGSTRWFELRHQTLALTAPDAAHSFGVLVDVTEQAQREAELLAILRTAVDGIILIDETGRIEMMNGAAERLFGYATGELIGERVEVLMGPEHRSRHAGYLQRYLQTGEARIIGIGRELEAVTRDGRTIPVHLSVSEVQLQGSRRFTGFVRDLSAERATQALLDEQRERLAHVGRLSTMGEMTASIAHEINQPLTAIAMYAQSSLKLIARGQPDLDKLSAALDKLNTQSLRAGAIIERIQRFSRAEPGHRDLVQVNALLRELLKLTDGDARLHNIELVFDLAPDLPLVLADPIQIQQVALNLIRNGIDAMNDVDRRHGSVVRVVTRALPDQRIEVRVEDQGAGVPEEQGELVFSPFHTTKKDGMGMGLSICRTIIAEHGGELGFHNRITPEHGAVFHFTLPVDTGTQDES